MSGGTTGVGGTSPDALLTMCVKYPAAVPKPAPPNTTSHELLSVHKVCTSTHDG